MSVQADIPAWLGLAKLHSSTNRSSSLGTFTLEYISFIVSVIVSVIVIVIVHIIVCIIGIDIVIAIDIGIVFYIVNALTLTLDASKLSLAFAVSVSV